jgi:hypothetical protein
MKVMSASDIFTAAMCYKAKEENFSEMCRIWKDEVFSTAPEIPGLISMQFITEKNRQNKIADIQNVYKAYAIGIWESISCAENYMKTGVFKRLMERLDGIQETPPESRAWNTACYFSQDFLTE